MVVVMAPEATAEDIAAVVDLVQTAGGDAFVSRGVSRTIVGLVGDVADFEALNLGSRTGVLEVIRVSVPFKLVSREHHPARSVIRAGGVSLTGAERAETFRNAPLPRMTNIRVEIDRPLPAPGAFEEYGPEEVRDLLAGAGVLRRHPEVVFLSGSRPTRLPHR